MARFNINDCNKDQYSEVSFKAGLYYISIHTEAKLYSDGLEFGEFMVYVNDHYEYEDGCYLGKDADEIIRSTGGMSSWIPTHKFYIVSTSEVVKNNHLTLGVYENGQYKYNVVREEDLENHIDYNKTFRFGRLLYIDGKRVYDGCMKESFLAKYDKIAEDFFTNHKINMNVPTIPYE